ncbi:hypothetical protein ACLPHM_16990 [Paenalcaligenes sp. Me131]|uniref:hypothetical protein n=1 Tax=Paenalcaligenes sp. Me131 TaxID=3392636 RepID=UPI003D2D8F15
MLTEFFAGHTPAPCPTPHAKRSLTAQLSFSRRYSAVASALFGCALLGASLSTAVAATNKDEAALYRLYDVLTSQLLSDRPLEESLVAAFPIKRPISYFEQQFNEETDSTQLSKPDQSISPDEWKAIQNSDISAYSESGNISYTLMDLDNDGQRDLIIESYIGGTGLFSYTGVLKRAGEQFVPDADADQKDDSFMPGELLTENGRGANQWSTWLDIDGQIYALFFDGTFGQEKFYLLRPFHHNAEVPVITVSYKTEFTGVTPPDKSARTNLAAYVDQAKLFSELGNMQNTQAVTTDTPTPLCPVPADTAPEDIESYSIGSALHYSVDGIGTIPVWAESSCYVGSVYSYFGLAPGARRAEAQILLRDPYALDSEELSEITVWGVRKLHTMAVGWEKL